LPDRGVAREAPLPPRPSSPRGRGGRKTEETRIAERIVVYADAVLRHSGRKVVGAKRGDGRTVIHVETGSGDCSIGPRGIVE